LYLRQSTYLRHHNSIKPEKPEVDEKNVGDYHSDSDSEPALNNGKLFGSLEPHVGDEIKILSAAISDVCVLEVNHGIKEGTESTVSINGTDSFYIQKSISSTSEANGSVSAGNMGHFQIITNAIQTMYLQYFTQPWLMWCRL